MHIEIYVHFCCTNSILTVKLQYAILLTDNKGKGMRKAT